MAPIRYPAEDVDVSPLAQPLHFEFSGKTAPNRFIKGAMSEHLATWHPTDLPKRGVPTKELINAYRRWGEGGFGVLLSGNVMIKYDHLEGPGNPIVPQDAPFSGERFEAFKAMAAAAKAHGSLFVAQVSHPGRQVGAQVQPNPISASDVQLEGTVMGQTYNKPRAMDKKDIEDVVDAFAHAAQYLHKAGYDGIQLHGAHGYLLAQFLSLSTNKRTDEYGGPLLNRARIIFEIADEIHRRVADPSFIVSIKVNSVEFQDGAFSVEECRDLCVELEKHRVDFVELSGGTYQTLAFKHVRESTRRREAYFIEFADMIVPRLSKTKVYVTGGLRTAAAMVAALGSVHGVGLGRPACHEFDLPKKILEGKVKSAIHTKLDEQNFALDNTAAGTQIGLVGQDKEPIDFSSDAHKDVFLRSFEKWVKEIANDPDGTKPKFVQVEGLELHPYGTPY
ncbi:NADH:flavin oxidoreductase/NADH oxidase [Biscogniauxia mediterranea]|nr:NADH:flavin oxidoreductase/NADH oxidase [Biscogniauxia mediterranea]